MLQNCLFIATSIYLLSKSSRIHDNVMREPVEEMGELENQRRSVKQKIVNQI